MKQTTFISLLVVLFVGMMAVVFLRSNTQGEPGAENTSQYVPTLKGAVQFCEEHAFTRTIRKFEELVR